MPAPCSLDVKEALRGCLCSERKAADMLSESEKEYIIGLLQQGQELPEDFRNKLFPVRNQEYELAYAGKMRREDLFAGEDGTHPAPIQINKVFAGDGHPAGEDNWRNLIVFGDNLQFLKTVREDTDPVIRGKLRRRVKLVYIDPPFATTDDFASGDGVKSYSDKKKGAEFIEYIRRRLLLIRDILADDGSIFVHLDWKKAHYIKLVLDEVFGEERFVNEIVWHYPDNFQGNVKGFANNHNVIFWYSKTRRYTAEKVMIPLPGRVKRDKRVWSAAEKKLVSARDEHGKLIYEVFSEKKADDVWDIGQSSTTKSGSGEFIDYPTQKPEELLRRILLAATAEGDIVMDCFAGSGTLAAVAEKLGRRWVVCDIGKLAYFTIQRRMLGIDKSRSLRDKRRAYGKPARAFMTCSLGAYDLKSTLEMDWEEYRAFVARLFEFRLEAYTIGGYPFDGRKGDDPVVIFPHRQFAESNVDERFLADISARISRQIPGGRVYVIAPSTRVDFLTDYCELDRGVRCYFLKIPYQMINELHQIPYRKMRQPQSRNDVNAVEDIKGFGFNRAPAVESALETAGGKVCLSIRSFTCKELRAGRSEAEKELSGFELLSAVFIDRSYDGEAFQMTDYFFLEDIARRGDCLEIELDSDAVGGELMAVYTDIYGNDCTESFVVNKGEPM